MKKWWIGQFVAFGLVNAWVTCAVILAARAALKVYSDFDVTTSIATTVAIKVGFILPASGLLFSIAGVVLSFKPNLNEHTLTKSLVIAAFLELFLLGVLLITLFMPVFKYMARLGGQ
jgi:hypothetical protein